MAARKAHMLHHIDVHVRDLAATSAFFDGLANTLGYRRCGDEPGFVGYETESGGRPRIGFIHDPEHRAGSMRLAFSVDSRDQVDAMASVARERGARVMEGPGPNPEYGKEYYAVFFEDPDGNKYEILVDAGAARKPKIARIWRGRVRPGKLERYREYIEATGLADYRKTPGNAGAYMLTAPRDGYGEVLTLSFWGSLEAIAAFAGEPIDRARYYPEDRNYLLDFPERVDHYEV